MANKKPTLERINPGPDNSVFVRQTSEQRTTPPFWHFHPELELVYVDKGEGRRHIGNHLSYFHNSQLLLIGANLPHSGFSDKFTRTGSETYIQFKEDFLGKDFFHTPEMSAIAALFERAKKGVLFQPEAKVLAGPKIKDLINHQGFARIIRLLDVLQDLALSKDYTLLNVDGFAFETTIQDSNRIEEVYKHINHHFDRTISLEEISDLASMTVPAFCRYFKKSTGRTFTRFVNEFRIVQARRLLSETNDGITDISIACGFNNFSHFNKLFKEYAGKSASEYRKDLNRFVQ
jgi:AraC-like DNA-binding protein